jgi:hypothetical protein
MPKLVAGVVLGLLVAFGVGWFWGASGRWNADKVVQAAELRSDLFEARSLVLAARVDLYNTNFGEARRHLQDALAPLGHAMERLKSGGRAEAAKKLDAAAARIAEAQQLAGRLDLGANSRAADAAKTIDNVLAEN